MVATSLITYIRRMEGVKGVKKHEAVSLAACRYYKLVL
jgi:hypothetical protein